MKIGIIILNYLVYQDTINCVNTLKKQDGRNVELKIIIVDNNSNNNSAEILDDLYKDDNDIEVLKLDENHGFANGNNEGYKMLLKYMNPDFVIISNDDILVNQPGLFEWIQKKNEEYEFGILGPSIYSSGQKFHQSPIKNFSRNIYRCRIRKLILMKTMFVLSFKKNFRIQKNNVRLNKWNELDYKSNTDNLTLHGSFLIFSKKYFSRFDLPFDDKTYLYLEEHILKLRCDWIGIPMVYAADYEVVHLQGTATAFINKNQIEYSCFRAYNELNSLRRYIQLVKEFNL